MISAPTPDAHNIGAMAIMATPSVSSLGRRRWTAPSMTAWRSPVVIPLIFVILYLTYKDLADTGLMMLAVQEALAGGAFFQFLFPKLLQGWDAPPMDFSVAVWVGYIACFGMATETGIIMLVYLREAIAKRGGLPNIKSLDEPFEDSLPPTFSK
jgi:Cu/Ag efflux pump CusA